MRISGTTKKGTIITLVIILLAAAGAMVVKKKREALQKMRPPSSAPLAVNAVFPRAGVFPETRKYLGTITAKVSADIAPRIPGQIFEVSVREGQQVKKGQILALIDDRQIRDKIYEFRARLAAAKSAYETQQGIFKRDVRLFKARAISQEQLDNSRARRDAARAEVATLKSALQSEETELSYSRLRAPFDGVIIRRQQDPGDLALVGSPVLSMEQPSAGYYIEIKVPQAAFPLMKKGENVFLIKEGEKEIAGPPGKPHEIPPHTIRISRVHPAVGLGTLATVEADVNNRPFGLPTGATVTAKIETGTVKGLQISLRALLENVDSTFVFLADKDSVVRVRKVDLLYKDPDWAVVRTENLPRGARVIIAQESALLRLYEGEKVKVIPAEVGR